MTINEFLTTNDRVFYDIETNYGDLTLIHAFLDDAGNQFCVDGTHTKDIIEAINSRTTPLEIVGFSITFDLGHAYRNGLDLNKVIMRDLRAMYIITHNTLDGKPPQLNLPYVLDQLLRIQMSKDVRSEFKGMTIDQLQPHHFTYAMNDIVHLTKVDKKLTKLLEDHDLVEAYNFEMEFQKCLIYIECNGMLIDVDKAKKFYDDEMLKRQEISDWFLTTHGVKPGTTNAFKAKWAEIGYRLPLTDSGAVSMAAENVSSLDPIPGDLFLPKYLEFKAQENLCKLIYTPSTAKKDSGSILTNVNSDNRIRPWFDSLGTVTGRLTASRPNVLAMNKGIRSMFIAPEGSKIVSIDFSAQEPLIGASLANCQKSLDKYYDPAGYHNANLKIIYKTLYDEDLHESEFKTKMFNEKKSYRDLVKTIGLGVMYGMSAYAAAMKVGDSTTKDIFQDMINILITPEIIKNIKNTTNTLINKGYIQTSVLGHKVFINLVQYDQAPFHILTCGNYGDMTYEPPLPYSSSDRKKLSALNNKIKNFPIQGNAAVITKAATIELTKLILSEYPSAKIINLVHDEIVFEVPDSIVDEFVPRAELIMQEISIPLLGNKLKTETTINTYWKK
jgi:DNA polymerase I-like protein with 3'-5' exonuclease and polymerase domains